MLKNKHDSWIRFCQQHGQLLYASGVPAEIHQSEQLFRELLYSGSSKTRQAAASLQSLSVDQWSNFEGFVAVFFREFESYEPLALFPAFRLEIQRRDRD